MDKLIRQLNTEIETIKNSTGGSNDGSTGGSTDVGDAFINEVTKQIQQLQSTDQTMNNAIGDHETRITNNTSSITSLTTRVAEAEADILEVDTTLTQNYTSFNEQLTSLSGRVTTLEGGSNSGSSCSCPSDFDGAVKAVPFSAHTPSLTSTPN